MMQRGEGGFSSLWMSVKKVQYVFIIQVLGSGVWIEQFLLPFDRICCGSVGRYLKNAAEDKWEEDYGFNM